MLFGVVFVLVMTHRVCTGIKECILRRFLFFWRWQYTFSCCLVHDVDIQYLDAQQLIMNLYSNYVPLPTKKSIKKGTIEGSS